MSTTTIHKYINTWWVPAHHITYSNNGNDWWFLWHFETLITRVHFAAAARDQLSVTRCDFTPEAELGGEGGGGGERHRCGLLSLFLSLSHGLLSDFFFCGRQASPSRRYGDGGRLQCRESRAHRLWSGGFLHASTHHPQTHVVGKIHLQCLGVYQWRGLCCPPPTPLSSCRLPLIHTVVPWCCVHLRPHWWNHV